MTDSDEDANSGTRASNSWGALSSGAGPEISLTVGASGKVAINIKMRAKMGGASDAGAAGVSIDGADPSGSATLRSVIGTAETDAGTGLIEFSGLSAGAHTFTMKYIANAGTLTAERRAMFGLVLP